MLVASVHAVLLWINAGQMAAVLDMSPVWGAKLPLNLTSLSQSSA